MKRLEPHSTLVLIVDVQVRLAAAMPEARLQDVVRSATLLVEAANLLGASVVATEQYPKGLGSTLPALRTALDSGPCRVLEKASFTALGAAGFEGILSATKPEAVLVLGMEAHVCVFQTVRDLVNRGLQVQVVAEGVCSRRDDHRAAGLGLAERAGALLTTAETVVFDWLGEANHPQFKAISKLVR